MSTAVRPRKPAKRSAKKARAAKASTTSTAKMPALVPVLNRSGARGALYAGGVPGNAGGGRPPSWYLARVAEMLEAEMPAPAAANLETDAAGPLATPREQTLQRKASVMEFARDVVQGKYADATVADRLRAWKDLFDKAMPSKHEVTIVSPEITSRLERQIEVINSRMSWSPAELLDALDPVWS